MTHPASAARPPFLYVGGDPALDLVNTVDWTSRGPEDERIQTYEQATRWAEGAGTLGAAAGRRLRLLAAERPRAAASPLEYLYRTRATLHDLLGAIARGEAPGDALPRFNRLLADVMGRLEVAPRVSGQGHTGFGWRWRGEGSDLRALVWPVVWSAASLLESEEVGSVRICGGDDCGWMYVDRSRNGLRRWCQMRTCGTREKTRRRRESA
ncbi:MAG: CGNR zinc finger domain-containing protein [Gemmatimonadales bacterium]|nr:CGNR zinc finger domain-containing protein [Gemmatimonadales bacterium]